MAPDYKKNICANITYLRKVHGISRTAMCKTLHISQKTLDLVEQGTFPRRLNFSIVYYAAEAFHTDPYHIMYTLLEKTAVLD